MNMSLIFGLPFSTRGWTELLKKNLSIPLLAWLLVVPLSFVPPVLMYYAGTHYGDSFLPGFGSKDWHFITTTLFLAELLTFFVMGWLIHSVLEGHNLKVSYHDAYLVAAIAPLPLWLSSLALLIPMLLFNVLAAAAALALSITLVYQGCKAISQRSGDDVVSMSATYTIIAASFLAWVLLLLIVWAY
ncbi:MAG TPA: YIP1 family protein [Gammaproteobacteria bacterium]|nr:YIP1 family protein [Gammaproteobacteria bacterium]